MNYGTAHKRFNITNHLKDLEGLDRFEMIDKTNKECKLAEDMSIPRNAEYRRDVESLKQKYVSALSGLSFFLQQGKKPYGVNEETFQSFRPLIESLVKRGELNEEILAKFT